MKIDEINFDDKSNDYMKGFIDGAIVVLTECQEYEKGLENIVLRAKLAFDIKEKVEAK